MRANAFRLTAFALCLLFARAAAAQETAVVDDRWHNGVTEPWWFNSSRYTAEQAAAARALWERIGGGGDDGWAGDYAIDMSVRAHFVRWSPKGFVFFNVNACMANVDDLYYSETVSDSPDKFVADLPRGARTYVKVKWGEQRYLVEEYAVAGFCDYVAGLGYYNDQNAAQANEAEFF